MQVQSRFHLPIIRFGCYKFNDNYEKELLRQLLFVYIRQKRRLVSMKMDGNIPRVLKTIEMKNSFCYHHLTS